MKKIMLFLLLGWIAMGTMQAQTQPQPQKPKYSTFWDQRATLFEELPVCQEDIIFLGNSITNGCEWFELFNDPRVKNRGISGDICEGVYDRLDQITKGQPAQIFLLIGINDVARGTAADTIAMRIGKIIDKIKQDAPHTELLVQSVLPVNDCYGMFEGHTSRWQMVKEINELLQPMAAEKQVKYVDLYSHFVEPGTEKLNPVYSNDGLHLLGKGYLLWRDLVKPYMKK